MRQGHHIQRHLAEVEGEGQHLTGREVATGCTAWAACLVGSEEAGQNRRDLVDWVDGEDHRWGNRREPMVEEQNLVRREGSCRRVFEARWEEDEHSLLKVRWVRLRA